MASYLTLAMLSDGSPLQIAGLVVAPCLTLAWFLLSMRRTRGEAEEATRQAEPPECRNTEPPGSPHPLLADEGARGSEGVARPVESPESLRKAPPESPAAPLPDGGAGMKEVYLAGDLADAALMCASLQCSGIEAEIKNEYIQQSLGGIPPGMPTYPRVVARESQAAEAAELVKAMVAARKAAADLDAGDAEDEEEGGDEADDPEAPGKPPDFENVPILVLLESMISPFISWRMLRFLFLAAAVLLFVLVVSRYVYHGRQPPLFDGGGGRIIIRH